MRKSEHRARALLEAIPDMVFRLNGQGIYVDFKADPADLYAQSTEKFIGSRIQDRVPPDLAIVIDKNITETIDSGQMHTFEYQLALPGKGLLDFETRMVKCGEDEVTAIVRNITELKKVLLEKDTLEKELGRAKRMESIGLMAGGVAHDLNNILAGIVGYPDLILQTLPPGEHTVRPQKIGRASCRERV